MEWWGWLLIAFAIAVGAEGFLCLGCQYAMRATRKSRRRLLQDGGTPGGPSEDAEGSQARSQCDAEAAQFSSSPVYESGVRLEMYMPHTHAMSSAVGPPPPLPLQSDSRLEVPTQDVPKAWPASAPPEGAFSPIGDL